MNYKRAFVENGYIHIIIVTYNRKHILTDNIDLLRTAFKNVKTIYPFEIISICILPDHIHMIINPNDIHCYPQIVSSIKHYFSKNINLSKCRLGIPAQQFDSNELKTGYKNKREKGIFQRRFYEHTIKSEEELNNHINYIHYNPVKHKFVDNVKDWEYSSFHKFVRHDLLDNNWGSTNDIKNIIDMDFE